MLPGSHGSAPFLPELPLKAQLPRVESAGEERLSVPDLACRGGGVQLFISAVSLGVGLFVGFSLQNGGGTQAGKRVLRVRSQMNIK